MAITDTATTNLANTVPQMYSHMTADYREANFVFVNLFDRKYESDLSEGDRVFIHGVNSFQSTQDTTTLAANPSSGSLGAAGAGDSSGVLTFDEASLKSRISLIADTHVYQAFELEYEADLFSNIGLMEKLTKASGYAVAHRIDDDAAALVDNFSQTVGTAAVGLTESDIKRGVQYLNDAFAPEDSRVFVFSPAEQMNLFGIERFVNAQYSSSIGNVNVDSKYKGYVTNILGLDWYMSLNVEGTNAAGHDNGMWQKEACATLVVEESRPVSHYEISTDTTRYAVHAIYGFVEVRDDHGVWMKGM
tara:strand:- start:105 stop:1016 length:912 start_codon:yes stop_codon:yes gene_type:complete